MSLGNVRYGNAVYEKYEYIAHQSGSIRQRGRTKRGVNWEVERLTFRLGGPASVSAPTDVKWTWAKHVDIEQTHGNDDGHRVRP